MIALYILAYLAAAAWAWTHIYAAIYRFHRREYRVLVWNNGDRMFGIFWGGFIALCWPLTGVVAAAYFAGRWLAKTGMPERLLENRERRLAGDER